LGAALKRLVLLLVTILMVIPAAFVAMQDNASPINLQITGINRTQFPTVVVNANVTDKVGQPVLGLGIDDFSVVGELTNNMKIVKVENVTDDSLSFSVVLAIDTSSSMDGQPIERAKEAAISFINIIGPNDPVAIVTFDNKARLIQDFTTDKTVLTDTINNLRYGGQTALYDASALAVATAGNSPITRRAVIILSDGQEYRASTGDRGTALTNALQVGVPVYTIGEGFGFDRSYLKSLADETSAIFSESPTPEQLKEIYDGLARTLRSQYIITMTTDLPGDGKIYPLDLEAKSKDGATADARVQLRARIYKPIVSLPDLPTDPIAEPTTVTAQTLSDDGIASATFQLNGDTPVAATAPYTFTIDPATLASGPNTLTFTATDTNGDTTSIVGNFTVAPKPPKVAISGVGETVDTLTTATITGTAIEGTVQGLIVKVNDAIVGSVLNKDTTTVTLDPAALPPGENTLTAIVRDTTGGRTESTVKFTVPALAPTVSVSDLTAGETIIENRTITVDVASPQTAVTKVVYKIDGKEVANQTEAPFALDLDVKAIGVGNHILTIEATNEGGASGKADIAFAIAPPPTATPTVTPTNTSVPPTATNTSVPATNTSVPPTATNTSVAPTATNTTEAATATNTSAPATTDASATTAVQANVATSDASTAVAAAPTDTKAPPTDTKVPPTDTNTPTKAATATQVEATAEVTEAATAETTAEVTKEVTVEVTEAATAETTAEVTKEVATAETTAEVTEAATAETTAEQTQAVAAATNTTAATDTKEATAVSTNTNQAAPTFTPIPLTAENQGAVGQSQSPLLIGAACLLGLLLLAIVYWFAARRRNIR